MRDAGGVGQSASGGGRESGLFWLWLRTVAPALLSLTSLTYSVYKDDKKNTKWMKKTKPFLSCPEGQSWVSKQFI